MAGTFEAKSQTQSQNQIPRTILVGEQVGDPPNGERAECKAPNKFEINHCSITPF
jgi:hypothetical protein